MSNPKVLIYDIETSPIIAHVWDIWDQNVGLNQIVKDWHILSWAAKWLNEPASRIKYMDQRHAKKVEDDSKILKGIRDLLDEADIVVTQNGKKFDEKRLNARFVMNGLKPPSPSKHIDTCQIAKSKFGFTSNKLEYMTDKLNVKYKKLKHAKFPGHEMWVECLKGNKKAWDEMEKYNKYDVLALEELYLVLQPWDPSINFNLYRDKPMCNCGSSDIIQRGYAYTPYGKYTRYVCKACGAWTRSRSSQISTKITKALKAGLK